MRIEHREPHSHFSRYQPKQTIACARGLVRPVSEIDQQTYSQLYRRYAHSLAEVDDAMSADIDPDAPSDIAVNLRSAGGNGAHRVPASYSRAGCATSGSGRWRRLRDNESSGNIAAISEL